MRDLRVLLGYVIVSVLHIQRTTAAAVPQDPSIPLSSANPAIRRFVPSAQPPGGPLIPAYSSRFGQQPFPLPKSDNVGSRSHPNVLPVQSVTREPFHPVLHFREEIPTGSTVKGSYTTSEIVLPKRNPVPLPTTRKTIVPANPPIVISNPVVPYRRYSLPLRRPRIVRTFPAAKKSWKNYLEDFGDKIKDQATKGYSFLQRHTYCPYRNGICEIFKFGRNPFNWRLVSQVVPYTSPNELLYRYPGYDVKVTSDGYPYLAHPDQKQLINGEFRSVIPRPSI